MGAAGVVGAAGAVVAAGVAEAEVEGEQRLEWWCDDCSVPRKLEPVAELDCLTLVAQLLLRGLQLREELAGHGGFHATRSRLRPRVLFDDLDVEGGLLENGGRHVAFFFERRVYREVSPK